MAYASEFWKEIAERYYHWTQDLKSKYESQFEEFSTARLVELVKECHGMHLQKERDIWERESSSIVEDAAGSVLFGRGLFYDFCRHQLTDMRTGQPAEAEQIKYRGYIIHLLGRVEYTGGLRLWHYDIYDEAGEKASYGGNPSSSDRSEAIYWAKQCVDECIYEEECSSRPAFGSKEESHAVNAPGSDEGIPF